MNFSDGLSLAKSVVGLERKETQMEAHDWSSRLFLCS